MYNLVAEKTSVISVELCTFDADRRFVEDARDQARLTINAIDRFDGSLDEAFLRSSIDVEGVTKEIVEAIQEPRGLKL